MPEATPPQTMSALEALRLRASQAVGLAALAGRPNLPEASSQQGLALGRWVAGIGDEQAGSSLKDPAGRALLFQRLDMKFDALPLMPRLRARGLTGGDAVIDRARMALGFSGRVEFGDAEELMAAIEARRIVMERGLPRYWSREQRAQAKVGLESYTDRAISESLSMPADKRAEAFKKMGRDIGMLGANCDLMSLFCHEEELRARVDPEAVKSIQARQEELVAAAKDTLALPSLDRAMFNVALAGVAGVGMAALAPMVGQMAMPLIQEVAHALPYFKGMAAAAGEISFNTGTAVSCAALAASVGTFLGVGYKAPSRLDALSEAAATRAGLGAEAVDAACARAADERLCGSFVELSDEMLASKDREEFVRRLGFARSRIVGPILRIPGVGIQRENTGMPDSIRDMPASELALLGHITEPALAACFLLDATKRSERLALFSTQKRLDYLGSSSRPLAPSDAELAKSLRVLVIEGKGDGWAAVSPKAARATLAQRLAQLSPKGVRLAALCPRAQREDFLASLLEKPFDPAAPDMDIATRLAESLKRACARLERQNFFERKLSAFVSKSTRALIENPLRAMGALRDWAFSKNPKQSMDFQGATQALARASSGVPIMAWGGGSARMEQAQARHDHDLAQPMGPVAPGMSAEEGLRSMMDKMLQKRRPSAPAVYDPARSSPGL